MPSVLVTGGAGFIGSHLVDRLLQNPEMFVIVADSLVTGNRANLPHSQNVALYELDVNDRDALAGVFNKHEIEYVFHFAALVGVQRTLANPVGVLRDAQGIQNIALLARDHNVKRVFFASSSEVYGESVHFPQDENLTPLNTRLPYAVVKAFGEACFQTYARHSGLSCSIFRFFNTYGPRQNRDFVVAKFIDSALHEEPLTIYGDGKQTRTLCFVEDSVEACMAAWTNQMYVNDVLNIGSEVEVSIADLARLVISMTDSKSTIVHVPALAEGDMRRRCPRIDRMRRLLQREPIRFEEGLRRTILHASSHMGLRRHSDKLQLRGRTVCQPPKEH